MIVRCDLVGIYITYFFLVFCIAWVTCSLDWMWMFCFQMMPVYFIRFTNYNEDRQYTMGVNPTKLSYTLLRTFRCRQLCLALLWLVSSFSWITPCKPSCWEGNVSVNVTNCLQIQVIRKYITGNYITRSGKRLLLLRMVGTVMIPIGALVILVGYILVGKISEHLQVSPWSICTILFHYCVFAYLLYLLINYIFVRLLQLDFINQPSVLDSDQLMFMKG